MTPLVEYEEAKKAERQVFLMSRDQIAHYWPEIVRVLRTVESFFDFFTPEWTFERAMSGDLQVWGFTDGMIRGIAVTQILVYPAQKAFEVLGAGGPGMMDFLDEMETVFERIASDAGCRTIIARARPGLARVLARKKDVMFGSVWIYREVGKKRDN